ARDDKNSGVITLASLKAIYKTFMYRRELRMIFNKHALRKKILSPKKLLEFLRKEMYEFKYNEQIASDLIAKYEFIIDAKNRNCMTFEGFTRFMSSSDNYICQKEHCMIYQDMTLPLSDYFISTSHNTYLISDQLVGQSHLWGYVSALMRGCRCLEIDCWDGPEEEPVVYHGYTLTSKLLFKSVIYVIDKYAFVASHYPVVLSLENHCSPRQQEAMAEYLITILGDKLLSMTVGNSFSRVLPSPEELKYKILIKNKKIGLLQDTVLNHGKSKRGQVGECMEEFDDDMTVEQERSPRSQRKNAAPVIGPLKIEDQSKNKQKEKKIVIAMELSDLVIYTKSVKFISFEHARAHQKFYENNSIAEGLAQKLAKQSVALNFQTPGIPMDLQNGKFQDNGGCGYILKPKILRNIKANFNPHDIPHGITPMILSIRIISGFQLPPSSLSKSNTANSKVVIEIYGVPADQSKRHTQVQKNNAFSPQWNEVFTFTIHVPELALVRFCVQDQLSLIKNEFLGQNTVPLTSINKGYRHVPLLNKHYQSLEPASLFVHVWYY
ncbi:hypothetical protein FKM82_011484, partial [Ascaphus truei]